MKETNRIITQNFAKAKINTMSEWLREYEELLNSRESLHA